MSNLGDIRTGIKEGFIGKFGEQDRYVHYDLNAYVEMEHIYGSMEKANEAMQAGKMEDVRNMLWLGLLHDQVELDPISGEPIRYTITKHEVGSWLTPSNMKEVMGRLTKAINGSVSTEMQNDIGNATPLNATAQASIIPINKEVVPTVDGDGITTPILVPNSPSPVGTGASTTTSVQ